MCRAAAKLSRTGSTACSFRLWTATFWPMRSLICSGTVSAAKPWGNALAPSRANSSPRIALFAKRWAFMQKHSTTDGEGSVGLDPAAAREKQPQIKRNIGGAEKQRRRDEPPRLPPEEQGGRGAAQGQEPAEGRDPAVQSGQRRGVGDVAGPRQPRVDHLMHVHPVRLSCRLR